MRRSSSISRLPISNRESMIRPRNLSLGRISNTPTQQNPSSLRPPSQNRGRSKSPWKTPTGQCFSSATKSRISQSIVKKKQSYEQAYLKVVEYIRNNHSMFDPKIVNENTIKPPSLPTFIYLINVLLEKVYLPIKISLTTANYKDVLPNELKTLKYPETVTQGTFRLVNSMHAFPQVMSLFAWLIKLINIINYYEEPLNHKVILKYFFTASTIEEEDFDLKLQKLNDEFRLEIDKAIELDNEAFEKEKNNVEKFQDELQIITNKCCSNKEETESIKLKILQMHEDIKKINDEDYKINEDFDNQLVECKRTNQSLNEQLIEKRKKCIMLKETIKSQQCSQSQHKKLKQRIENLKNTKKLTKQKIDEYQKVKDDFDFNMCDGIKEIERLVHRWNTSLIKLTISKPETKMLLLKETWLNDEGFQEDIQKITEESRKLEKKFKTYISEVQKQSELELIAIENIKSNIFEETKFKNALILKISELKETILVKEKEAKMLLEQIQWETSCISEELLSSNKKLLKMDEFHNDLDERNKQCLSEIKSFGEKSVVALAQLQNQIVSSLKEYDRVKTDIMKAINTASAKLLERAEKDFKLLQFRDFKESD